MSENQSVDVQKHVRMYVGIFVGLIVMTLATVLFAHFVKSVNARITIAVVFALLQGFFSVAYLMHLNAEKRLIYIVLILTVVLFAPLILLPLLTTADTTAISHVP
jgi:cytochrome c oxidase subunit IV